MSGKSNLRKLDLGIDEEKDIFLSSINKKIRNNRKKIEAIDDLAKRDKATLNQEQLSKIKSRAEVLENIKYHETIKDMYYGAFKTAKDEGRLPQPAGQQAPVAQTQAAETIQPAVVQQSAEDREAETARITSEILSKVLNLVHVAQFYRDQNREVSEAESIYELYTKIFTFSESDRFVKINDKISGSLNELQSYINGVDQPALRNLSYSHLQQTVERLASSSSFRSHNAEVRVQQVRTTAEPSAIGSELRRGQEDKLDVPVEAEQLVPNVGGTQDKHRSPEKAVGETGQKDWGQVEDEEEEEEEEVEEEREVEEAEEKEAPRQPEEERKINPYEDFVEVKGRQKEKKEEKPTRGGYRGSQRGGYRGGERGPRKPRVEGEEGQQTEGQQGGYRGGRGGYRGNRPRTEGEGQQEGAEGENRNREGGYRGGRGGYRGGNRGGYRGGNRGGNFQRRNEEGARQEVRQEAPSS